MGTCRYVYTGMMPPEQMDEQEESHSQWCGWVRSVVERIPGHRIDSRAGLLILWSGTLLPIFNQAIIVDPVADRVDLEERIHSALKYAEQRNQPWVLSVCEDSLPHDSRAVLAELFGTEFHLERLSRSVAMKCDEPIAPRPVNAEFRRVESAEDALAAGDLNCSAYGMPLEWGRDAYKHPLLLGLDDYSYLAIVEGKPVSTATVSALEGRLYVSSVATAPQEQRKGYAGAVLYHALEQARAQTGLRRSILHASEAGYKLYERLGYSPINCISLWAPEH